MAIFLDNCLDAADWMEVVGYDRPVGNFITLDELNEIRESVSNKYYDDRDPNNYWDYPLSETEMLATEEDRTGDLQLVRFADGLGGFEYRWCEV